ncbi:unnamed protein product [Diamesa hyperborea]
MSRNIAILYGSQTGTAQDISENVWRESKKFHFKGSVMSMDDYDVRKLIDEEVVIFICSTTGQGDEPDNMKNFWKFLLRKSLPTNSLGKLHFGVIGLGDSSYQKFNFVAKRLHKRLIQLGANPIQSIGNCDDQHDLGIGAVLFPWIENLWKSLIELKPLPSGLSPLAETPRPLRWNVTKMSNVKICDRDVYSDINSTSLEGFVEVKANTRTTSDDHFQDVRLISLSKENLNWNVGDVAYIRPKNSDANVNKLFEIFDEYKLGIKPNDFVVLEEIDNEMPVPEILKNPHSIRTIASQYWDLSACPRARFFQVMAYKCDNELEKEKLLEFASFEGQQELYSYVNRPRRGILEVLGDFPHATSKLCLEVLFELFQPIKQRPFSIASSVLSDKLELLVAVVEYKTLMKEPRRGLCSNWLKNIAIGERVQVSIKKGTFQLPKDKNVPLIMVGPGTGLAPFRSILQEYELSEKSTHELQDRLVLFFGCRSEFKDFHCQDDLRRMESANLLKLFCAFSRDQEDKIYVQHLIRKQSKLLKKLIIDKGGYVLLSGSSKNMPEAVREALGEALGDNQLVEEMYKNGKYQEETWA